MSLGVTEYAILTATVGAAVIGLFIGFSGSLAFLAATVSAAAAVYFGWMLSADLMPSVWMRGCAVSTASLFVFGIVRWIVRKMVHGLMAQPGDAIFGAVAAGAVGLCLSSGGVMLLAMFGFMDESYVPPLLREILSNVGG